MAFPPSLELAVDVAREAGALLADFARRRRGGDDLDVTTKTSATDPVSEADRATERLIAERLFDARPDDGLVGEEGEAPRRGTSGYRWVVDPLDGTVNFLYDRPTWCVSIGVEDAHGGVIGVVHAPVLGETWIAARGQGTQLVDRAPTGDGAPRDVQVSAVDDLADALVATGFSYLPEVRAVQVDDLTDLVRRVRDVRRGGSAALDLAWTASGRLDGYLEAGLHPWDWTAGALLVREAGGAVTLGTRRYAGHDLTTVVAGGPSVHDRLDSWLDTARPSEEVAT